MVARPLLYRSAKILEYARRFDTFIHSFTFKQAGMNMNCQAWTKLKRETFANVELYSDVVSRCLAIDGLRDDSISSLATNNSTKLKLLFNRKWKSLRIMRHQIL